MKFKCNGCKINRCEELKTTEINGKEKIYRLGKENVYDQEMTFAAEDNPQCHSRCDEAHKKDYDDESEAETGSEDEIVEF